MSHRLMLCALWLAFVSACGTRADDSTVQTGPLVGGQLARTGIFPATAYLPMAYCGAAKIGDKVFLTAAHCIDDHRSGFAAGKTLTLQFGVTRGESVTVTVVRAETHPSFTSSGDMTAVSDLGLIWVQETTSALRAAHVRKAAVTVGTAVVLSGYGCVWDEFAGGLPAPEPLGLKYISHKVETVQSHFFTTPRKTSGQLEGRICPGDSGTPAYLDEGIAVFSTVVGVNSFRKPPGIWSAMSRVDVDWLETSVAKDNVTFVP